MSLILTFLGKGGSGRTTVALAAAKKLAGSGVPVLLVEQDSSPALSWMLDSEVTASPSEIAPNFSVVQLQTTLLLEQNWEKVKELEAKYLRSPTLNNIYGQELGILPGMDQVLALNALREYDQKGEYGVIIYDGTGDLNTLRMLGISEILSWYVRRFRQVFTDSDLGRVLSPFFQPIASAILNTSFSMDNLTQDPNNPANDLLEEGKKVLADPKHLAAYLVTTEQPLAIAKAKYLWGSAQQSGIIVKGVLVNQTPVTEALASEFDPLPLTSVPQLLGADWEPLVAALPNFREVTEHLKPLTIDMAAREVRVFLPGLTKKQVKLTQYGPEITIEAGDQRRNIDLPGPFSGQPVKGAKFQNGYLVISF